MMEVHRRGGKDKKNMNRFFFDVPRLDRFLSFSTQFLKT